MRARIVMSVAIVAALATASARAGTILRDSKACPIKGGLCLVLTQGTPVTPFLAHGAKSPSWLKAPDGMKVQTPTFVYIGGARKGDVYATAESAVDSDISVTH